MAFLTQFLFTTPSPFFAPTNTSPSIPFPLVYHKSVSVSPRNLAKFPRCHAAAKQQGGPPPVKNTKTTGNTNKKRKKKNDNTSADVEIVSNNGDDFVLDSDSEGNVNGSSVNRYHPLPLPKPPAGFVLDEHGKVLMASTRRIATIIDPTNNFPLECVIRRVFRSSGGDECMLLCPVDTPVQILKSTNIDGWSAVSDEEVEAILPAAAYALAKIHMHLVHSGFCYTARGGFCYSEDNIFDFRSGNVQSTCESIRHISTSSTEVTVDDGQDVDGLPTEGVEITCFHLEGSHYMVYTPSDPLLFVAVKDRDGNLQMADDDLLEDPAIISAIDEETEFNALVEEEAALLESLLGER